jgi:hypothetical protein
MTFTPTKYHYPQVLIKYAKNINDLKQKTNIENVTFVSIIR